MTNSRDLANLGGGFIQAGGGVQRTVESKLKDVVSVKDFGAVGDGVTDDTAAIQAAFNASVPIFFPPGLYLCNNSLSISDSLDVTSDNATLIFAATKGLSVTGVELSPIAATTAISSGSTSLPVGSAGIAGDLFWIEGDDSRQPAATITLSTIALSAAVTVTADASCFLATDVGKNIIAGGGSVYITGFTSATQVSGFISNNNAPSTTSFASGSYSIKTLFAPSRPYYKRGELSVSTGGNGIQRPCIEDYSTDYTIHHIRPFAVSIDGLTIRGDVDGALVAFDKTSNSLVSNCTIENQNTGSNSFGLLLSLSDNTCVANCTISSDCYSAIVVNGCQNTLVTGGYLRATNHCVDGSSSSTAPPTRFLTVVNLSATSTSQTYALYTHAGASNVLFDNCTVFGGAAHYCKDSTISNCTVSYSGSEPAIRLYPETSSNSLKCLNNTVNGSGIGIRDNYPRIDAISSIIVRGNTVNCTNSTAEGLVFSVRSEFLTQPHAFEDLIIQDNNITSTDQSGVVISSGSKSNSRKISVYISSNKIRGKVRALGILGGSSQDIKYSLVNCNSLICNEDGSGFQLENITHSDVYENQVTGLAGGGNTNSVTGNLNSFNIKQNYINNFKNNYGLNATNTFDRALSSIADNRFISTLGTKINTVRMPFIRPDLDTIWSRSTAAPTGGTYQVGDIVWNSTPTAGGFIGWVCVTAGSPGTWKSFGTISA